MNPAESGYFTNGATMTEWYAGLAMQGIVTFNPGLVAPENIAITARRAFDMAEAMVTEYQRRCKP